MSILVQLRVDHKDEGKVFGQRIQIGPSFKLQSHRPRKRLAVYKCLRCGDCSVRDCTSVKSSKGIGCYGCVLHENGVRVGNLGIYPSRTHGLSRIPEYKIWGAIKERCNDPNNRAYSDYGGRGITICDDWNRSFVKFYEDMGSRPSKEYSIDRINNDGNYEPGNCRWATKTEQANNRRPRRPSRSK